MTKYIFLLAFCGMFLACPATSRVDTSDTVFIKQAASVKVYVATRGSYQYLLEVTPPGRPSFLGMPSELPASLQQDGQRVQFSGALLSDSTMIMKPGATDIPEADFKVPNILIKSIEEG